MVTPHCEIRSTHLLKLPIQAVDGSVGKLADVYFDDCVWRVRYLVIDTGGWLPGRKVLISPNTVTSSDFGDSIAVSLSRDQIRNSPDIDTDRPVSRQHEKDLASYYEWLSVPPGPMPSGVALIGAEYVGSDALPPQKSSNPDNDDQLSQYDPCLRSLREVKGYHIEASDGDIGHADDFTIDPTDYRIVSLIIDTGNWFGTRQVMVPVETVQRIRWEDRKVRIRLRRADVEHAPDVLR